MEMEMSREDLWKLVEELGGEILKATGSDPKQIVKSLLFISEEGPVLVIVDGESRVDINKLAKIFGKIRLATPEEVRRITGFEVGSVPPVGINVRTLVDRRVLENRFVVGGGGRTDMLSRLDPRKIVEYQNAEVVDIRRD